MKLERIGKADAPEVLLFSGAEALQPLAKKYCLLLPSFDEETTAEAQLAALEKELRLHHGGRIRGVYARDAATGLALALRSRACVDVTVVEGGVILPDTGPCPGEVVYWHRKKDKAAKDTRAALKTIAAPLSTLTMKKLPKGMALADRRPDLALAQLEKAFGGGVTVTRSSMVPGGVERVWRELTLYPAPGESTVLSQIEPVSCDDETHVQLLEGRSKKLKKWSHRIHLESADDSLTYVTDQIELDAGKLNALAAPLTGLYLRLEQQRRRWAVKSRHAL